MTNLEIAKTISEQIGNKAFYMIGAKQMVAIENGLQFRIGRNSKGVNMVQIVLNGMDTYDIKFLSIRGMNVKEKAVCDGYYSDMIHDAIEENTGMYTSL